VGGLDSSYAVMAVLVAVMGVLVYARLASAWRTLHDDGHLRLEHMVRRQGADSARAPGLGGYQAALATRRCVTCAHKEDCDALLKSSARGSVPEFCPNREFIKHVART